jgi:hypothetical protein
MIVLSLGTLLGFFHKVLAEVESVLQIYGKMLIAVAAFLFFRGEPLIKSAFIVLPI